MSEISEVVSKTQTDRDERGGFVSGNNVRCWIHPRSLVADSSALSLAWVPPLSTPVGVHSDGGARYSRLAGADEERTLARPRGLRSDLIDRAIAAHHGRVVKRTLWLKRHGGSRKLGRRMP